MNYHLAPIDISKLFTIESNLYIIANEQPSQEARLRGGSFIESCEGEKFSNSCNSGVKFMSVTL